MAKLQRNMAKAHRFARKEIESSVARQTCNHDKRATDHVIAVRAMVYYHHSIKVKGRSPKLQRLWTGPWTVTARVGAAVYEIRDGTKTKVVHYDALKVVPPPHRG